MTYTTTIKLFMKPLCIYQLSALNVQPVIYNNHLTYPSHVKEYDSYACLGHSPAASMAIDKLGSRKVSYIQLAITSNDMLGCTNSLSSLPLIEPVLDASHAFCKRNEAGLVPIRAAIPWPHR